MTIFPGGGTGTSTFGAVAFWVTQQGARALPRRGRVSVYQRDHIPYGGDAVVQLGGTDTPAMQYPIVVKTADYATLLSLVNTVATLTISGESAAPALLAGVADAREYAEGYMTATLTVEH